MHASSLAEAWAKRHSASNADVASIRVNTKRGGHDMDPPLLLIAGHILWSMGGLPHFEKTLGSSRPVATLEPVSLIQTSEAFEDFLVPNFKETDE